MKNGISLIFIVFAFMQVFSQERGFKVLKVKIEGDEIELYNESHALIIGNSVYTNGWNSLPGVKEDVEAVKATLEKSGFNVVVHENLNKPETDKAFSEFIQNYGKNANNRLLFYYAGHGNTVTSKYGDELGYIVPVDAPNPNIDEAGFQSKSVEMAQIEIYAKRIDSKHALFIFDACFAGSLFAMRDATPAIINYKTKEPVRQFITSGSADETVPDKSIFRQQFVTALTSDAADSNHDGYLTGTELGTFLQDKVVNYSYNNQHPQYGKIRHPALDKGDFVFQLNENKVVTTGSIILTTDFTGELYINDKFVENVTSGANYTFNDIDAGMTKVEIRGHENWNKTVQIIAEEQMNIFAERLIEQVHILSHPTGAEIYLDNKYIGKTPYSDEISVGKHQLELKGIEHHYPTETNITIAKGKANSFNYSLKPSAKQIQIISSPPNAEVYVNGEYKGIAPLDLFLNFGDNKIKLAGIKLFEEKEIVLNPQNSTKQSYSFMLNKIGLEAAINSEPTGAKLYINGNFIDNTPVKVSLNYGSHKILLEKQHYDSYQESVLVNEGQTDYTFKLHSPALEMALEEYKSSKKKLRKKRLTVISTLGVGVVSYLMANNLYNEYQTSTDIDDKATLKSQVVTRDIIAYSMFGLSTVVSISSFKTKKKKRNAENRIKEIQGSL